MSAREAEHHLGVEPEKNLIGNCTHCIKNSSRASQSNSSVNASTNASAATNATTDATASDTTSADSTEVLAQIKKKDDPICASSGWCGNPWPKAPEPEVNDTRIGYYSPDGEWKVPENLRGNHTNATLAQKP